MKILAFLFLLLICEDGNSNNQLIKRQTASFDIVVKINNLGRNYTGCGIMKYHISVTGLVQNPIDKIKFGEEVILFFNCPETLNNLPFGQVYKLKVEFLDEKKITDHDVNQIKDKTIKTRFNVLSTKVLF